MEELFTFAVVVIGITASIISSVKKERERKAAEEHRQAATAAQTRSAQLRMASITKQAEQAAAFPQDGPTAVITPTVHTHYQPDCDVHDAPGSLGLASDEGKDPCHESQLTHAHSEDDVAPAESGLTLDWSGEGLVKAFVMQEVLTRPCDRRAR